MFVHMMDWHCCQPLCFSCCVLAMHINGFTAFSDVVGLNNLRVCEGKLIKQNRATARNTVFVLFWVSCLVSSMLVMCAGTILSLKQYKSNQKSVHTEQMSHRSLQANQLHGNSSKAANHFQNGVCLASSVCRTASVWTYRKSVCSESVFPKKKPPCASLICREACQQNGSYWHVLIHNQQPMSDKNFANYRISSLVSVTLFP